MEGGGWLYLEEIDKLQVGQRMPRACSDVIESAFGKFKQKINCKSPQGLSGFVLTMASFGPAYQKGGSQKSTGNSRYECIKALENRAKKAAFSYSKEKTFIC